MAVQDSVSVWLQQIKNGDEQAAQKIWEVYFDDIARIANRKLGQFRRMRDGEDVALSCFDYMIKRARAGKMDEINNRNELRRMLVQKSHDKAIDFIRHEISKKRGGRELRGDSVFLRVTPDGEFGNIAEYISENPEKMFEQVEKDFNEMLDQLEDDVLKQIALQRIHEYSTREIGASLNIHARTVRRKLEIIEKQWYLYNGKQEPC